jgi:hypothetical protein
VGSFCTRKQSNWRRLLGRGSRFSESDIDPPVQVGTHQRSMQVKRQANRRHSRVAL